MILLIDNYDSFTYNVYHYLSSSGLDVQVYRNDRITIDKVALLNPEAIILSPGPGTPDDAGICSDIVASLYQSIPILGICLGQQVIAQTMGGSIKQAYSIKHGKTSLITHNGEELFSRLPQPLEVMRYHSLSVERASLSNDLKVTAESLDDNEIMALKHRHYPVYGIQFHPESIGTASGKEMIQNFLQTIGEGSYHEKLS
ncbi:anthranilate synthase component 2/anthranilate synthase/phosphoribosyltransferase [Lentibacillus persicus]|uniref:Anthranilate synthase component 2/anthranilate synthase/phosphoribosyltransferase n=1 Tax=Lentibacillus persicus TaxID=640948 RepID=A0A1I1Y918_9BACI|nr:aminodeoxychorismate/anthranilate synthase component II [Lentibacillus persicus]SFE15899.1 anthranilate synthase component 2/anthranilate synthase/phosphoribosyltransferase [Lentibacillus persicus]